MPKEKRQHCFDRKKLQNVLSLLQTQDIYGVENTDFYSIQPIFFVKSSLEISATSTKLDHSVSCFKVTENFAFFNTVTLLFKCLFAPVILKVAHSFAKEVCLH